MTQVVKHSIKYILPSPPLTYTPPPFFQKLGYIFNIMVEPAMKQKKHIFSIRNPISIPLRKLRMQVIKNKKLPFIRKIKHKKTVFID